MVFEDCHLRLNGTERFFFLKERDPMDFRYAFMHVIDPTGKNK